MYADVDMQMLKHVVYRNHSKTVAPPQNYHNVLIHIQPEHESLLFRLSSTCSNLLYIPGHHTNSLVEHLGT